MMSHEELEIKKGTLKRGKGMIALTSEGQIELIDRVIEAEGLIKELNDGVRKDDGNFHISLILKKSKLCEIAQRAGEQTKEG